MAVSDVKYALRYGIFLSARRLSIPCRIAKKIMVEIFVFFGFLDVVNTVIDRFGGGNFVLKLKKLAVDRVCTQDMATQTPEADHNKIQGYVRLYSCRREIDVIRSEPFGDRMSVYKIKCQHSMTVDALNTAVCHFRKTHVGGLGLVRAKYVCGEAAVTVQRKMPEP